MLAWKNFVAEEEFSSTAWPRPLERHVGHLSCYFPSLPIKRTIDDCTNQSPPGIGATQKSQSCEIAQSPTNTTTPVLRAGFTDVFVAGMEIKWIRVRHKPMGIRPSP